MADLSEVPNEGTQKLLRALHFAYPLAILLWFSIAFVWQVIRSTPADATLTTESDLFGPGGRPLPRSKRRGISAQRERLKHDFSPAKKALFSWLSLAVLVTFMANSVIVITHALIERAARWWCGEHVVVYHLGSLTIFVFILLTLIESAPSPTWAHASTWYFSLVLELLLLGVSASFFAGRHREPSVLDRDPSQGNPDRLRYGAIRRGMTKWEAAEIAICVLRIVILISLLTFWTYFSWARAYERRARTSQGSDNEETTGLLHTHSTKIAGIPEYGTNPIDESVRVAREEEEEEEVDDAWKRPSKTPPRSWYEYIKGYSIFFPYLWPSKSRKLQLTVIFCFSLVVLQRVVNLWVPKQVGVIVDSFDYWPQQIPWVQIGIYVVLRALQGQNGMLGSLRTILWIPVEQNSYRELSTAAFKHVHGLSFEWHSDKNSGELIAALKKGDSINGFLESLTFQLIPMVVDLFLTAGYFLIEFDAYYALVLLIMSVSYLYLTIRFSRYRNDKRRESNDLERHSESVRQESLGMYETVKYFNAEAREFRKYEDAVAKFQRAEYVASLALEGLKLCQTAVFAIAVMLTCFIAAYQVTSGLQSIGKFTTLITFMAQLQAPLDSFASFYKTVQSSMINGERMLEFFKKRPQVVDGPNARDITQCRGEIHANEIAFAYDARNKALQGVTFRCAPGTTTALVGASGGGKSTMFRLLYRFYDLTGGNIEIDGQDIRDITIDSLRRNIGIVAQEPVLFNDTIMNNLRYADPNATDEEIFAAARAACIHHRIESFPDGYQTKVGERGQKLSGGERQRVSIARTLLKNPSIILFDEATASLDSATEAEIQDAMNLLQKDRTTLVIAHRLSTISDFDQILVLDQGKIAEAGTHDELMLQPDGKYKALWDKQVYQHNRRKERQARRLAKERGLLVQAEDSASVSHSEDERSLKTALHEALGDKKSHRRQQSSLTLVANDSDSNHDGDSDHI